MTAAYSTDRLRNVVLLGHGSSGKTSLAEALLFNTGAINRMGQVEEGTTVSDFDEEEVRRRISLNLSLTPCEWADHKINVLDAPGFVDFQGEAKNAVLVSDAAVIVVDAVSGPEVGTELAFDYALEFGLPILVVINKMDRDNANFENALSAMSKRFPNHRFVPVMMPIGSQADFKGVVDVMNLQAFEGDGQSASDIPSDLVDDAETVRLELLEAAAEGDDALMEKYFETETLTDAEISQGLRAAGNSVIPVFAMSSTHNIGVLPFLNAVIGFVNPPDAREITVENERGGETEVIATGNSGINPLAYVFHSHTDKFGTLTYFRLFNGTLKNNDTLYNLDADNEERLGSLFTMRGEEQIQLDELHAGDIGVVSKLRDTHTDQTLAKKGDTQFVMRPTFSMPIYAVALQPRTQSDSTKMGEILTGLTNADPTLNWYQNAELKQTILEGMGGTHINVAIKRADALGVGLDTDVPKVPYQETITKTAEAEYTHKKQTGGAGQYGRVFLRVEPLPSPTGDDEDLPEFEFANEIFGGAISQSFVGSTEKGVRQVLGEGVIADHKGTLNQRHTKLSSHRSIQPSVHIHGITSGISGQTWQSDRGIRTLR